MERILRLMAEKKASDVYLSANSPALIKINGQCVPINNQSLPFDAPRNLLAEILSPERMAELDAEGELNMGFPIAGVGRFRVSAMRQRGSIAAVFRYIAVDVPALADLFSLGGISATGSFFNPFNGQSARLPVQTTGNPNLTPEKADTFSVGATYEARSGFLSGARLSVDYYKIKVKDVIASVGATDILTRCFQGVTTYCPAIQFDNSTFGIAKVFVQPFNQSILEAEGLDIEAGYRTDLKGMIQSSYPMFWEVDR